MTRLTDRRKLSSSVLNATHAIHLAMRGVCAERHQTWLTALNAILLGKKSDHVEKSCCLNTVAALVNKAIGRTSGSILNRRLPNQKEKLNTPPDIEPLEKTVFHFIYLNNK